MISKKTQVPLRMPDRADTNFLAPFIIHSKRSESTLTLDILKCVFSVFRRKPSLVSPDSSRSASPMRGNPTQSRILDSPHVAAVASGFQAMEVRISCQCNLDSGFQSFAGSLIIQAGLQIPKPSNIEFHNQKSEKKFPDSGFHEQRFPRFRIGIRST